MIHFNRVGFEMLAVAAAIVVVVGLATGVGVRSERNGASLAIVAGVVLVAWDLYYRHRQRTRPVVRTWNIADAEDAKRWLMHYKFGGHVMFFPIWLWGSCALVWGIAT